MIELISGGSTIEEAKLICTRAGAVDIVARIVIFSWAGVITYDHDIEVGKDRPKL